MSEREATLTRLREKVEEETAEEAVEEAETVEEVTEEKEKPSSIREYVILTSVGAAATSWKEEGRVPASSAESAIRTFATKQTDGATFVAVPARNWHPVKVKVETTTAIRLSASE